MRRLISIVVVVHCLLLTLVAFWSPSPPLLKKRFEVRTVKTRPFSNAVALEKLSTKGSSPLKKDEVKLEQVQQTQKKSEKKESQTQKIALSSKSSSPATPSPSKKSSHLPAIKKERVEKNEPLIPAHLLKELEETVAKIEQKEHKIKEKEESLVKKLSLPQVSIAVSDPFLVAGTNDNGSFSSLEIEGKETFVSQLVTCLGRSLCLPEKGDVKLKIMLSRQGSCLKVDVLESQSRRNEQFLLNALFSVKFPPFTTELGNEKEHSFVITFCER